MALFCGMAKAKMNTWWNRQQYRRQRLIHHQGHSENIHTLLNMAHPVQGWFSLEAQKLFYP
jgi:hypothetical protein